MKTVLVTGASGFIGRHLCLHLRKMGCRVRGLTRTMQQDFSASELFDEGVVVRLGAEPLPPHLMAGVDTVFHLAGVAHSELPTAAMAEVYWAVNLRATEELLQSAKAAQVGRFVYFSSVKAAASPPKDRCVDEAWQGEPMDVYGLSKRLAEQKVLEGGIAGGMHVCNLRPVLVYGSGVKGNLRKMIEAIKADRFPSLPETGNRRSLVHVADVVQAAMLAAEHPDANGKTYIVADNHPYSTRKMYETIRNALGMPISRRRIPYAVLALAARIGDGIGRLVPLQVPFDSEKLYKICGSACYSSRKLQVELGFHPRFELQDALPAMVASLDSSRP
ncbi:MAG: NAD-dependent epimerase/dehydratase family protein [Thermodesulfobacteriota bacterium]